MKVLKFLLFSFLVFLLLSCASSDRPHYLLGDSLLHTIHGGDSNTYAVLDANSTDGKLIRYTETLNTKSLFAPDNSAIEIQMESFEQEGNLVYPFVSRLFNQDENGNLILLGISRSGENYWIVGDTLSDIGKILLPQDLSTIESPITISSSLQFCENKVCDPKGTINVTLEPLGTETVETSYADFDTYKFSLQWDISLSDSENANNSVNQSLIKAGTRQWIHPAIGVVKFIYEVNNDTQSSTLFGNLNQTTISIPDRYKK